MCELFHLLEPCHSQAAAGLQQACPCTRGTIRGAICINRLGDGGGVWKGGWWGLGGAVGVRWRR